MIYLKPKYSDVDTLLFEFNKRRECAFSEVYIMIFDELHHFAKRLFFSTGVDAEDLLQDIFVAIWDNRKMTFISLDHVKNYIYTSIKNKHKNFLKYKLVGEKYEEAMRHIDDIHFSQMVETEIISLLSIADNVLTSECSKVLHLYLEGYDVKEIAFELGKSHNTVYHQRKEAILTLKKYLHENKLLTFFTII